MGECGWWSGVEQNGGGMKVKKAGSFLSGGGVRDIGVGWEAEQASGSGKSGPDGFM